MKRTFSLILALLLVTLFAVSCGGGSSPVGEYVLKTVNGKTVEDYFKEQLGDEAAQYLSMLNLKSFAEMFTLELKADGTASFSEVGEADDSGKWELKGDKVIITADGETTELPFKNGELTLDVDGQTMVFKKK